MPLLNYRIIDSLETSLNQILPETLSEFACQIQDGSSLSIWFMPKSIPTTEELMFLAAEVADCIDSILPVSEGIPTWFATVDVGAERSYNAGSGGKPVFSFWGKTTTSPSDFRYLTK